MKLSAIKENPQNPRTISREKFERLKKSIQDFPQMMALRPIVVDAEGVTLGGNMRLEALKALGYKDVPDEWVKRADELTPEQKREFVIKDNAGFGEWDWSELANAWDDLPLADWGVDLPEEWLSGNGHKEEDESAVAALVDRAAELQRNWDTKSGQLWEIPSKSAQGKSHRLLIGDCTEKANVGRLCADNRPSLMVTDPPYGVDYRPVWRNEALGTSDRRAGAVQNDDRADWTEAWKLSPSDVVYCWHADLTAGEVRQSLEGAGFEIRNHIVWAKDRFVIGRGHYHSQHETAYYAVRKGATALWRGDHSQSTLWSIPAKDDVDQDSHGTQKPTECMQRAIRNHEGDVYDPFVGSGTTVVAAEAEGRVCYAMDIDPAYAAVTLERLSALGLKPELQQ